MHYLSITQLLTTKKKLNIISLSFTYIDIGIFRYRFYIIVNISLLFRYRDDYYIIYIYIFYITSRIAFYITFFIILVFLIIITFINSKNSLIIIIFF